MDDKDHAVAPSGHARLAGGAQPTRDVNPCGAVDASFGSGVVIIDTAHYVTVDQGFARSGVSAHSDTRRGRASPLISLGSYADLVGSTDRALLTVMTNDDARDGHELDDDQSNDPLRIATVGLAPLSADNYEASETFTMGLLAFLATGAEQTASKGRDATRIVTGDRGTSGVQADSTAHHDLAAPVLTSAQVAAASVTITGTLASRPNAMFTIEFFAAAEPSASHQTFLGSTFVSTNAMGRAHFTYQGTTLPPEGARFIAAMTSDVNDRQSEISAVILAE